MLVLYRGDTGQVVACAHVVRGEGELQPEEVFPARVLPNFGFTPDTLDQAKFITVPYVEDVCNRPKRYKVVREGRELKIVRSDS